MRILVRRSGEGVGGTNFYKHITLSLEVALYFSYLIFTVVFNRSCVYVLSINIFLKIPVQ